MIQTENQNSGADASEFWLQRSFNPDDSYYNNQTDIATKTEYSTKIEILWEGWWYEK